MQKVNQKLINGLSSFEGVSVSFVDTFPEVNDYDFEVSDIVENRELIPTVSAIEVKIEPAGEEFELAITIPDKVEIYVYFDSKPDPEYLLSEFMRGTPESLFIDGAQGWEIVSFQINEYTYVFWKSALEYSHYQVWFRVPTDILEDKLKLLYTK